jgi:hypothetical protein
MRILSMEMVREWRTLSLTTAHEHEWRNMSLTHPDLNLALRPPPRVGEEHVEGGRCDGEVRCRQWGDVAAVGEVRGRLRGSIREERRGRRQTRERGYQRAEGGGGADA